MNYIKEIIESDWEPTIKKYVYSTAQVTIFVYLCGVVSKEWILKLNDDTTKLFLYLTLKLRRV